MEEELKTIETVDTSPFKHLVMTLGELPTSFVDSMTYYECLAWLVNYIQNTVIPAVNNNAEAVEELQTAFTTLKNFVDNYFDNLDVQQEINNKLDNMAEDGELENVIATYVNPYINAQNQNINEFKTTVNNSLSTFEDKLDAVTNGTPLTASSTSEMTDTTKIYVNTTDGKWYYYNGTAWTAGGTYQSAGIGASTIGFNELNGNLKTALDIGTINSDLVFQFEQGIINANGTPGTDTSHTYWNITIRTSDYIEIPNRYLELNKLVNYIVLVWFYDSEYHLVGSRYGGLDNYDLTQAFIDVKTSYEGAKYFKLSIRQRTSIAPAYVPSDYDPSQFYINYGGLETPTPTPVTTTKYIKSSPDTLTSLPSLTFGTDSYLSGQTLVKDLFISFGVSDDDHLTYKQAHIFKVNEETGEYELIKTVLHNLGHVNTVDYCEETDCLIFGNGSGAYNRQGTFYIYKGFYDVISNPETNQLEITDCMEYDTDAVDFKMEDKWNVCWFDSNRDNYDLALLATNDLSKFRVLQLAKGNNVFDNGTLQSVGDTEFNGTFKVLATYTFDPSDTNDHVLQDMDYQSGKLYCGVSHNYPYYWVMTFNPMNNTVTREIVPIYSYSPTDGAATNKGAGAICCNDKYVFLNTGLIIVKPRV